MLVTGNGSVFASAEFSKFFKQNGIQHVTSAHHPASNGLAERAVPYRHLGKVYVGTRKDPLKQESLAFCYSTVVRLTLQQAYLLQRCYLAVDRALF